MNPNTLHGDSPVLNHLPHLLYLSMSLPIFIIFSEFLHLRSVLLPLLCAGILQGLVFSDASCQRLSGGSLKISPGFSVIMPFPLTSGRPGMTGLGIFPA